jgi:hypothetical protein
MIFETQKLIKRLAILSRITYIWYAGQEKISIEDISQHLRSTRGSIRFRNYVFPHDLRQRATFGGP